MNTNRVTGIRRSGIRAAVVATFITGIATTITASAVFANDDDRSANRADHSMVHNPDPTNLTTEWLARRDLHDVVATMPSGWPATEAMRRAANEPLGDAVVRARWQRDAMRMPAGWPATEAMRQAAAWPSILAP